MVGYNDSKLYGSLSNNDFMIAGATAGAVTRLLCQPLDVIKIRFQLQVEPLSRHCKKAKYYGIFQSTRLIVKEEGMKAMWKGHASAQILSIIYGVVGFSAFEYFTKQLIVSTPRLKDNSFIHLVCGGASNGLATLVSFPFDTVRTRLVGQGTIPVYSGLFNAFMTIMRVEGFSSLFRGLSPTIIQAVPYGCAQFACYNIVSKFLKKQDIFILSNQYTGKSENKYLSPFGTFIAGSTAGAVGKTAVYPLDLARKRLQIQGQYNELRKGFGKMHVLKGIYSIISGYQLTVQPQHSKLQNATFLNFTCSGLMHCLALTYKNERVSGLFKGLMPSLLKATVTTSLHFAIYEQTILYLAVNKTK